MKLPPNHPGKSCKTSGFTLVELLVTVAIIAILASLLLGALAGAKASARKIHCVANQKQVALSLIMYADDHGAYPLHKDSNFAGLTFGNLSDESTWLDQLVLYQGTVAAASDVVHRITEYASSPEWHACPQSVDFRSWRSEKMVASIERSSTRFPRRIYVNFRYNSIGAVANPIHADAPILGMGTSHARPLPGRNEPHEILPKLITRPGDIAQPSDMIAFGDGGTSMDNFLEGLAPGEGKRFIIGFFELGFKPDALARRHRGRANIAFLDGHVNTQKADAWSVATPQILQKFNRDHAPHTEWWR